MLTRGNALSWLVTPPTASGVTPLSSIWGVVICVLLYFATIRVLQRWVAARGRPFDLNWFVIVHNSLLSILSAVLFFALVSEISTVVHEAGVWSLFCDPSGRHVGGALYFIYFLNYIAKYVELIDTCLLALRGKPIPFLHAYHHAATLVLCWSQLWAQSCIQWLPIVINLLVHVVMYAYYTLHAMGFSIWWKKYLTLLQITQFIVALIGCVGAFSTRLLSLNFPDSLPLEQFKCHGTHGGAWVGIGIIASYLYLFVVLFREKYDDSSSAAQRKKKHASMRKIRPVLVEDESSAAQSRELAEKAAEKVNQKAANGHANGNGNGRHLD